MIRRARRVYIARAKDKGYLDIRGDLIVATEAGVTALPDFEPLPTGQALQDYWLQRLPIGEKAVLQVAIDAHPQFVDRDVITERTGYKKSSRDAYISRLAAKELLETPQGGGVKASDNLF
jgi:hypothetical protein